MVEPTKCKLSSIGRFDCYRARKRSCDLMSHVSKSIGAPCTQKMTPMLADPVIADYISLFVGETYLDICTVKLECVMKLWGCLFKCMSVRAAHIEITHADWRFHTVSYQAFAWRGHREVIKSVNASNFKGHTTYFSILWSPVQLPSIEHKGHKPCLRVHSDRVGVSGRMTTKRTGIWCFSAYRAPRRTSPVTCMMTFTIWLALERRMLLNTRSHWTWISSSPSVPIFQNDSDLFCLLSVRTPLMLHTSVSPPSTVIADLNQPFFLPHGFAITL